jgi:hypothetical protein
MNGRARVALHEQRRDAETREEDRGAQADRAAAGDEDGHVAHGGILAYAGRRIVTVVP